MLPTGRGGRGDGRGQAKRERGTAGEDDLADAMGQLDLRTDEQRERDRLRRQATQCIWIGWFPRRDDQEPATNAHLGGKKVYRRCAKDFTSEHRPYCALHWNKGGNEPGPGPEHDPSIPKDKDGNPKKKNQRGLGSMNDVIMAMMRKGGGTA